MTPEDRATLTRIETKLDIFVETQVDHTHRLHAVEKKFWYATGVAAALVGVIGAKLGFHV